MMMGEDTFLLENPELQLRGEGVGSREKLLFVWKCHWKLKQAGHSPGVHFQALSGTSFAICSNIWAGERSGRNYLFCN